MIHPYRGVVPKVHETAWIAGSADVIGDVELAEDSSVWFSVNRNGTPTILEDYLTVGHAARLHGCLIGIGAIILDGAVLEEECIVAAGAIVSPGTQVPGGSLVRAPRPGSSAP